MLFSEGCFPSLSPPPTLRLSAVAGMDLFAGQVEKKRFGDGGPPAWDGTAWTSLLLRHPYAKPFRSIVAVLQQRQGGCQLRHWLDA